MPGIFFGKKHRKTLSFLKHGNSSKKHRNSLTFFMIKRRIQGKNKKIFNFFGTKHDIFNAKTWDFFGKKHFISTKNIGNF
jgi:hypothetical protein